MLYAWMHCRQLPQPRCVVIGLFIYLTSLLPSTAFTAHYHSDVKMYRPWKNGKGLGELFIPVTTSSTEARSHFYTGVKLVHTYEFPEAMWSFREAQKLDPGFAMAYWGEMVASQMLVWNILLPIQAKQAYQRMLNHVDFNRLSPMEKGYIEAAKKLFISADHNKAAFEQETAIWKFRKGMQALHEQFPDDPEIKVFYGYSILGTRKGVRDFETNRQAAKFFKEVLKVNPQHPGALHYLLHASENTRQAFVAKQAAETFASVAPAAIHALHMPSHYYYTQGQWDKVITINRHAFSESFKRMHDRNLNNDALEYHGFGWVIYALLQQGKVAEALHELNILYKFYQKSPSLTKQKYLLFARAGFLADAPSHSKEKKQVMAMKIPHKGEFTSAIAADLFATGYAAFQSGNKAALSDINQTYKKYLPALNKMLPSAGRDAITIMSELLQGLYARQQGDMTSADKYFSTAATMEDNMLHEHGIPLVVKPANELYADFLSSRHEYTRAKEHYKRSLRYHPGRLMSLNGLKALQ